MARIIIRDLAKNKKLTEQEIRNILGGIIIIDGRPKSLQQWQYIPKSMIPVIPIWGNLK